MIIRSITQNAMDKKISIRQFPSPEHPYIAFPQKNLAVLDISRFTTGQIGPQSRLLGIVFVLRHSTLGRTWVSGPAHKFSVFGPTVMYYI